MQVLLVSKPTDQNPLDKPEKLLTTPVKPTNRTTYRRLFIADMQESDVFMRILEEDDEVRRQKKKDDKIRNLKNHVETLQQKLKQTDYRARAAEAEVRFMQREHASKLQAMETAYKNLDSLQEPNQQVHPEPSPIKPGPQPRHITPRTYRSRTTPIVYPSSQAERLEDRPLQYWRKLAALADRNSKGKKFRLKSPTDGYTYQIKRRPDRSLEVIPPSKKMFAICGIADFIY